MKERLLGIVANGQTLLAKEASQNYQAYANFIELAKESLDKEIVQRIGFLRDSLNQLASECERLSIFSILHISHLEDQQTYFLAWLLEPNETHGLGDVLLKSFLKKVCGLHKDISFTDLKIKDITIAPQKDIVDLGVPDIEISGRNFLCIVENKILAGETANKGIPQTRRYADYYTRIARQEKKHLLLVYLVPPSRDDSEVAKKPTDIRFKQILHSDVIRIVDKAVKESQVSGDTKTLIDMFLYNLRREICHEYDWYFEAKHLLDSAEDFSDNISDQVVYFHRLDNSEKLFRISEMVSRRLKNDE